MTRAEKVAMAQRLRAEGLVVREIAVRMGVARSTVGAYLSDPHLSKQKARRARYATPCEECGGPTDGSRGLKRQTSICASCREWSEEMIIDAISGWADEHGGIPPRAEDWSPAPRGYPSARVVQNRIGWNEALLRAGFALRMDRRPETQEWVEEQLRAGVAVSEIAGALRVSRSAIHKRVRWSGTTITALRREAA